MTGAEGKSDKRRVSDLFAVRSLLFLPASNPRAIAKARASAADMVVLDLEDAVRPEDKERARAAAVEAACEQWLMPLAIRVNGVGTQWHDKDVAAVGASGAEFAVLPRASSPELARQAQGSTGKPLLAMIETAAGVLSAAQLAHETAGLIAGTNDLRADLRLPLDATREPISAALQMIVLAGRAAGIPVFDGVFNQLTDRTGFEAECRHGRSLGFDGKSVIHPDQIAPCNRIFGPTDEELERAKKLVDAFSGGAERFEDAMIERMHVEAAQRVIERAAR